MHDVDVTLHIQTATLDIFLHVLGGTFFEAAKAGFKFCVKILGGTKELRVTFGEVPLDFADHDTTS